MTATAGPAAAPSGIPCPNGALLHDIIIVGGGPSGLAAAARLREQNPAAIFTDEEHRRFHWMRRHGKKMALKNSKNGRVSVARGGDAPQQDEQSGYDMVVLDADYDDWMGRWNHLFDTLEIKHLRSPMFWHCDPNDRDSLLSRAHELGREAELVEIKGCVGKEVSKHAKKRRGKYTGSKSDSRIPINERDRNDYFNPTQALFSEHCSHVISRYRLDTGLIHKERVLDISYGPVPGVCSPGGDPTEPLFTVTTNQGTRHAHIVILAVGPGNRPVIPRIPGTLSMMNLHTPYPQASHAMHLPTFPPPLLAHRISSPSQSPQTNPNKNTNILIIGGGLTSAQVADLALRRGVGTVWHVMRGPLRVKTFDVGLEWMGKFRNVAQARFWLADGDEERLGLLREARGGGGSVTPGYARVLRGWADRGRVRLFERAEVVEAICSCDGDGDGDGGKEGNKVRTLPPMDYIFFATGVESDFRTLPYLQTMLASHPIQGHGGFPCLSDDLAWQDGVPLFVAGRLAALRLGPSAPNLGGARLAAERIAWGVEEVMRSKGRLSQAGHGHGVHHDGGPRDEGVLGYVTGRGSMFGSLSEVSS
ncbi:FAD binding domain protein [Parathielavia hyrcaniae]|uniref:FAD binding domain protein n=1 Tax=Parathielavia hyrcaniae TaxID=113614 RepID=A0AAN6Q6K9_9PEZI|nr:FAD binding domain protein [Parathielavia hyrcaniae]